MTEEGDFLPLSLFLFLCLSLSPTEEERNQKKDGSKMSQESCWTQSQKMERKREEREQERNGRERGREKRDGGKERVQKMKKTKGETCAARGSFSCPQAHSFSILSPSFSLSLYFLFSLLNSRTSIIHDQMFIHTVLETHRYTTLIQQFPPSLSLSFSRCSLLSPSLSLSLRHFSRPLSPHLLPLSQSRD